MYFFVAYNLFKTVSKDHTKILWLDDMPNVDRLYRLLNNIYLARALRLYRLEEDLFAMLVFILRTRELAIVVTRTKEQTAIVHDHWKALTVPRSPSIKSLESDDKDNQNFKLAQDSILVKHIQDSRSKRRRDYI